MPRYYFHFVHRRGWGRDREGTELPDLRHAHVHAMRLLLEARTCLAGIATHSGWLVQITDEEGRSKLTVLFPATLVAAEGAEAVGPPRAMEV
jgi:hypothetical protein